jgi:hypothetical protein
MRNERPPVFLQLENRADHPMDEGAQARILDDVCATLNPDVSQFQRNEASRRRSHLVLCAGSVVALLPDCF